mmetsp:Transcript_178512/g.572058  ORF Transcript_178512/g.572058 Transcript_178512/m.572058 type:complete len:228 (-) Transcript_178512:165-848(-)
MIKSGRSATTASAERNQQSPTPPWRRSSARKPKSWTTTNSGNLRHVMFAFLLASASAQAKKRQRRVSQVQYGRPVLGPSFWTFERFAAAPQPQRGGEPGSSEGCLALPRSWPNSERASAGKSASSKEPPPQEDEEVQLRTDWRQASSASCNFAFGCNASSPWSTCQPAPLPINCRIPPAGTVEPWVASPAAELPPAAAAAAAVTVPPELALVPLPRRPQRRGGAAAA